MPGLTFFEISGRKFPDWLLFGVTVVELGLLFYLAEKLAAVDWIYVSQHLLVLGIALTRRPPKAQDHSVATSVAVIVSYAYGYAQVAWLRWEPGDSAWPGAGEFLVVLGACMSLWTYLTLGRWFGVRPALRGLATEGPYRFVRHPMYLSYVIADIGYNLVEWDWVTVLLVAAGWASLVYRIYAEERVLSRDAGWPAFAASVRHRLIPGIW